MLTKKQRVRILDNDILYIESIADSQGVDLDNMAEWVALCAVVTDYQFSNSRYSKKLMAEYGRRRQALIIAAGIVA